MSAPTRNYPDLHDHLETLKAKGLLITVDEKIDKDAELHPLVRWAFVGGMNEAERKAFLFTNIVDGKGRKYSICRSWSARSPPIARSIPSAWARRSRRSTAKWERAIANPVEPRIVNDAPCHEVVHRGQGPRRRGARARRAADPDLDAGLRQRADA